MCPKSVILLLTAIILFVCVSVIYCERDSKKYIDYDRNEDVRNLFPSLIRKIDMHKNDINNGDEEDTTLFTNDDDISTKHLDIFRKFSSSYDQNEPDDTSFNFESSRPIRHFDPWSIVWYVGSFGGLVIFFLVVSCSEWCCRRGPIDQPSRRHTLCTLPPDCERPRVIPETPPPAYHLFAPPPYDSVCEKMEKQSNNIHIYVVPVHHQKGVSAATNNVPQQISTSTTKPSDDVSSTTITENDTHIVPR